MPLFVSRRIKVPSTKFLLQDDEKVFPDKGLSQFAVALLSLKLEIF